MYVALPLILLVLFAVAVAWLGNTAGSHTVDVQCRCGAKRTTLCVVEKSDAARYADVLTEGCPRCRAPSPLTKGEQRGVDPNRARKEAATEFHPEGGPYHVQ